MPSHSVHIEALLKVFPDARLIWTHRDPVNRLLHIAARTRAAIHSHPSRVS